MSCMPDHISSLHDCTLCPRRCHANRVAGPLGHCRSGAGFGIGSICVHRGEEPALGEVCNIFFTHCNLQCVYCQNWQISRNAGPAVEHVMDISEALRRVRAALRAGARAVGFVSPSHCIPQMNALMEALGADKPKPTFVMNTNGYDAVETIRSLDGRMDVYLPDLKYMDADLAERLSGARDYPEAAAVALIEMRRQKGLRLELDETGCARSGLIIRHLVLPGHVENSLRCLRFIAEEIGPAVHLSLLAQYRPVPAVAHDANLGRPLRQEEYAAVLDEAERLGFTHGWTQSLESMDNYTPDFALRHPFESRGEIE